MARWGSDNTQLFDYLSGKIEASCIKRLNANKNKSGIVTATLEVMGNPVDIVAKFSDLPEDIEITSVTQSGAITSVSFVDKTQDVAKLRVEKSAIFKTITEDVYQLYTSGILTTDIVPGNMAPQAEVYVKSSKDVFESRGWLVGQIFSVLGLDVQFPSAWDYYVTELSVTSGLPIITLVQNLFPFPALLIHRVGSSLYISRPAEPPPSLGSEFTSKQGVAPKVVECNTTAVSRAQKSVLVRVEGDMGEMRYIRCSSKTEMYGGEGVQEWTPYTLQNDKKLCYGCGSTNTAGEDDFVVQCNALGGIFAILKVVYLEDQASIPSNLWSSGRA